MSLHQHSLCVDSAGRVTSRIGGLYMHAQLTMFFDANVDVVILIEGGE